MKHSIMINKELCISCSICVKDCPVSNIEIKDKKAQIISDSCLFCSHCKAICPKDAIEITGYSEDVEDTDKFLLNSSDLMKAIKTRRTIRNFKDEKISNEIIENIIEAGIYAPTARNNQDVSYVILDNKKDELESYAVNMFRKIIKFFKPFSKSLKRMEIDDKFFFKGAPIVIVIISSNKINGAIAAQNMAFMAESYDLGVLYSGLFSVAANKNKKIKRALELTGKNKVVTTLVIGYPAVKYHRIAYKEDAKVLRK